MSFSKVRRGALAVAVVTFAVLLTACGGSSSNDSSSSGDSGSGGGSVANCMELAEAFAQIGSAMDPDAGMTGAFDFGQIADGLDAATSKVPSSIRDDWKVLVDAYQKFAEAYDGIDLTDMNAMMNPANIKKMEEAAAVFDSAKVEKAMDNIDAWGEANCGSMIE